jgi:hypothetical protein
MAKYKFDNFNVQLINPIIDSITTVYTKGSLTLEVSGVLDANGNKLFGVYFGVMDNSKEWTDVNIEAFALAALEKHKV